MRRALLGLLVLAGCHNHEQQGHYGVLTPRLAQECGGPVGVCVAIDDVMVTASAPAGSAVRVEIDIDEPHASVACQEPWTREVVADEHGEILADFPIRDGDDCAPHDTMKAWLTMPDGTEQTSAPFTVPQRTSP
jgi:hypothetical protein